MKCMVCTTVMTLVACDGTPAEHYWCMRCGTRAKRRLNSSSFEVVATDYQAPEIIAMLKGAALYLDMAASRGNEGKAAP